MAPRCPGAHSPSEITPFDQLVLSSDLWHDPLLKINLNLFLPRLSPPKEFEVALPTSDGDVFIIFMVSPGRSR